MEKRKFTINYDKNDDDGDEKDKYTFVIPNSNIENISIVAKKKANTNKKEMETKD